MPNHYILRNNSEPSNYPSPSIYLDLVHRLESLLLQRITDTLSYTGGIGRGSAHDSHSLSKVGQAEIDLAGKTTVTTTAVLIRIIN